MSDDIKDINVDLDNDRLKEIVSEAFRMIKEYLGGNFLLNEKSLMDKVHSILRSKRISSPFFINLGSSKIPDLELRIDPIRKEVLCKSRFKKKVSKINHFMRIL